MGLKDDPLFAAQPKWDEGGPPEQYQILTVHTPKGMTRVILFSKDILKTERPPRRATMQSRTSAHERGRSGRRE